MSTLLTPTTELEAVNTLLSTIGEAPVNSLEDQVIVDAVVARATLKEVSRELQAQGWHWNTEDKFPLARNANQEIVLPPNALQVDVDPWEYPEVDPVIRGTRLYDKKNHTFLWPYNLEVTVIFLLQFTELPEAARRFVTLRAARFFRDRTVGDGPGHDIATADEYRALALLKEHETDMGDYNMKNGPAVARVLRR